MFATAGMSGECRKSLLKLKTTMKWHIWRDGMGLVGEVVVAYGGLDRKEANRREPRFFLFLRAYAYFVCNLVCTVHTHDTGTVDSLISNFLPGQLWPCRYNY